MKVYIIHRDDAHTPITNVRVVASFEAATMQAVREGANEFRRDYMVTFPYAVVDANGEVIVEDSRFER